MKGSSSTGRRPTRSTTPSRRLSPLGSSSHHSNAASTPHLTSTSSDAAARYNYSKYCNYATNYSATVPNYATNYASSNYIRETHSPHHSPQRSRRSSIDGLNTYDYIISKRAASNFDRGGGAAAPVSRPNPFPGGYASMQDTYSLSSDPYRMTSSCKDPYVSSALRSSGNQCCNCIRASCCSGTGGGGGAGGGIGLSKSTENLYNYKRLYNSSGILPDFTTVLSSINNSMSSNYGNVRASLPASTTSSYCNYTGIPLKQYNNGNSHSHSQNHPATASLSSSCPSKNCNALCTNSTTTASCLSSSSYNDVIGSRLNRLSLRSDSSVATPAKRRSGSATKPRSSSASRSSRAGPASSVSSLNSSMANRDHSYMNQRPQSSSGSRSTAMAAPSELYGDDREAMVLGRMVMPRASRCLVGLNNEGNTCYLNACLQCLAHTMPLAWAMVSSSGGAASAAAAAAAAVMGTDPATNSQGIYSGRLRTRSVAYNNNGAEDLEGSLRNSVSSGKRGSRERKVEADMLAMEFQELLRNMWSSSSRTYSSASAGKFLKRLQQWETQFSGYNQQDSQEAMRAILDGLHESLNRVTRRKYVDIYKEHESRPEEELAQITWDYHRSLNDSVIQDIFCGQLQSTIECSVCRKRSHCFDPFLDLSLQLPEHSRSLLGGKFSSSNKWKVAIQDCLSSFVAPETLTGHDKYRCSTCKVPQPSVKKLSIYRAPPILVLHLKRFHGSGPFSYRKDDTPVYYPLRGLDLTEFIGKKAREQHPKGVLYDLYGVCHHSGSIGYGHYTAQCRDVDGSWYSFNDNTVTPIDESNVISSTAYILFYQLRL